MEWLFPLEFVSLPVLLKIVSYLKKTSQSNNFVKMNNERLVFRCHLRFWGFFFYFWSTVKHVSIHFLKKGIFHFDSLFLCFISNCLKNCLNFLCYYIWDQDMMYLLYCVTLTTWFIVVCSQSFNGVDRTTFLFFKYSSVS